MMKRRLLSLLLLLTLVSPAFAQAPTVNYRKVINQAYLEILGRPGDPGGLDTYNAHMNGGMSEAQMRESLLRSAEYALQNPGSGGPPPPSAMTPLTVVGNEFQNASGPVKLLGYIICCDDPATPGMDEAIDLGWPLVNAGALDTMRQHKLNYTDIRLGPSIDRTVFGDGEPPDSDGYLLVNGKYDLTQWNPRFWARVRQALADASARGVYVGVSLIDSWVLDHELGPWTASRNLQGFEGGSLAVVKHAPRLQHELWIRKVVRETAQFPNVLYLDGNESFKGDPELDWIHGIRDIARSEMAQMGIAPARLFGSNSKRTDAVDYLVSHAGTVPVEGPIPHLDTEYQTLPPSMILSRAKTAWDKGSVSFHYWAGEHSLETRAQVLAGLQEIVEGGGSVQPVPANCPWLVKMGIKVHTIVTGNQIVSIPSVGSTVLIDLTPRFSHNQNDVNGKPCNDEHNVVCGGRECEDPRGGVYSVVSGNAQVLGTDNPFQFKIRLLDANPVVVRIEPFADYKDGEQGKPVRIGPNTPRELTIQAGVKPSASEA